MYLSLLILNLIFRIILESPQSGESPKPSHFKGSKGHENPLVLFKLGKSKDIVKYICLSFVSFLPLFHFCCIYYFGSLIFCCQFVARFIITGRKTFDKYCLFYILASLYALSSSLSLNILYIHSGIA